MKKIIYFICIMFLGFNVKAISPVVDYSKAEGIYSNRIGSKLYSGKMALITMDNKAVYCLEPYQLVGRTYYENNNYKNNINKGDLEYFELVSYYGYNDSERNNIYYYMASQELIWERIIGANNIFWTTGENGTGNRIDISGFKNEIIENVNKAYRLPSFSKEQIKIDYFREMNIIDNNSVIDEFELNYNGNSEIVKISNGIKVTMMDHAKKEIILNKRIKSDNTTIIYTGTGNQTLGSFGIDFNIQDSFYIMNGNKYNTKLILTFYNKKTKERIENISFKLCKNDEVIDRNWIHEDGKYISVNNLYEGNYKICSLDEKFDYNNEDVEFVIDKKDLLKNTNIDIFVGVKETNEEISKKKKEKSNGKEIVLIDKTDDGIKENISMKGNEEIKLTEIFKDELPNTSNHDFFKVLISASLLILGIIIYEKEKRN